MSDEKPEQEFPVAQGQQRPRAEHVSWCKARALEYLDRGDIRNAISSMISDMGKHPDTKESMKGMAMMGLEAAMHNDAISARRWIEGFN